MGIKIFFFILFFFSVNSGLMANVKKAFTGEVRMELYIVA